jgi:hypothetical protein
VKQSNLIGPLDFISKEDGFVGCLVKTAARKGAPKNAPYLWKWAAQQRNRAMDESRKPQCGILEGVTAALPWKSNSDMPDAFHKESRPRSLHTFFVAEMTASLKNGRLFFDR